MRDVDCSNCRHSASTEQDETEEQAIRHTASYVAVCVEQCVPCFGMCASVAGEDGFHVHSELSDDAMDVSENPYGPSSLTEDGDIEMKSYA